MAAGQSPGMRLFLKKWSRYGINKYRNLHIYGKVRVVIQFHLGVVLIRSDCRYSFGWLCCSTFWGVRIELRGL